MDLVAYAASHGVALVLCIRKMPGELHLRGGCVAAKKQAAGHGIPDIPHFPGVAEKAREAPTRRQIELAVGPIDDRLPKRDGKTDAGVFDLVIVGKVVHDATKTVNVQLCFTGEAPRQSTLEIISCRRLHRKPEKCGGVERLNLD